MKINLALLDQKQDLLSIDDMMEVFSISRSTLQRHERLAIKGFPTAAVVLGHKGWDKKLVLEYIRTSAHDHRKTTRPLTRVR